MNIDEYRNLQSDIDTKNKFSMLRTVQINPTELCNRSCSFCPRSDKKIYPNQDLHISVNTIENLCNGLKEINFNNRIGFIGFGEPLLCNTLIPCIKKVKEILPDIKWLDINTNGDKLTYEKISDLHEAGLTHIAISMYDEDKTDYFNNLKKDIPIKLIFRHHYDPTVNYNLNIVNRKEILQNSSKVYSEQSCFIPFYKLMIDWNGDVLLCENDWSRKNIFGNVNKESIGDIWFGKKINNHRKKLLRSRKNCSPCKNCSINGQLRGIDSVESFLNYY